MTTHNPGTFFWGDALRIDVFTPSGGGGDMLRITFPGGEAGFSLRQLNTFAANRKPTTWNEGPPDELKAGMVVEQLCFDKSTKKWMLGHANDLGGFCDCCRGLTKAEVLRWQWCWLLPPDELQKICEAAG